MNFRNGFLRKGLNIGRTISITIDGNCMVPTLKHGEKVLVRKMDKYSVGDIILFEDGRGKLLCHRINFIDNDIVITSGDNNNLYDPPIKYNNIFGKIFSTPEKFYQQPKIFQMNYDKYISSNVDGYHSIIILNGLNQLIGESMLVNFSGNLPLKTYTLILLKTDRKDNFDELKNIKNEKQLLNTGISYF